MNILFGNRGLTDNEVRRASKLLSINERITELNVRIKNAQGELKVKRTINKSKQLVQLNFKDLKSGIYVVEFRMVDMVETKKVFID